MDDFCLLQWILYKFNLTFFHNKKHLQRLSSSCLVHTSHADSDGNPLCVSDVFLFSCLYTSIQSMWACMWLNIACMCKSIFKVPQLFKFNNLFPIFASWPQWSIVLHKALQKSKIGMMLHKHKHLFLWSVNSKFFCEVGRRTSPSALGLKM